MSKERKVMPDEIMNQVKNNYKNFKEDKKREVEPASEKIVQKGYEPGEGFKRVFSGMMGDTGKDPIRASPPKKNDGFNKIFSSLVGEANLSYPNSEARQADAEEVGGSDAVIEASPSPAAMEANAVAPSSDQTSVFERLSRIASEAPTPKPHEQAVEASPVKEEPTPENHKMSVFERLSKHKV
ncbi:MAG: hypothetical protein Q8O47_07905 [Candidatus Bathyarchaeota archaeon]|nr:hypothetical protein [Candidatus Bathyarchaeota archaeon]